MRIQIRVFADGANVLCIHAGMTEPVGWFKDEVSAVAAAFEHILVQSAILPERRRIPEVDICVEYIDRASGHPGERFARATAVKSGPLGRRLVLLPWVKIKPWVRRSCP